MKKWIRIKDKNAGLFSMSVCLVLFCFDFIYTANLGLSGLLVLEKNIKAITDHYKIFIFFFRKVF